MELSISLQEQRNLGWQLSLGMYMFCSKVVEEPSVDTDCSFSQAYRSHLLPRTLPLLFQGVSKTEGGIEDDSSMMRTHGRRFWLVKEVDWKRSFRSSQQGENLVHPKWFQSTALFFKKRYCSPVVNGLISSYKREKRLEKE